METKTNSNFSDKAKSAYHTASALWLWLKIIGVVVAVVVIGYVIYRVYNSFKVEDVKTEQFAMNDWKVLKAQKLIMGSIEGNVVGRYGYRKIVHSDLPLIGERHDTLQYGWAGTKYVDVNGKVQISLGYDLLAGDRLFSNNAIGSLKQTKDSVILTVVTDYPVPQMVGKDLRTIPIRSDSWFSGSISDSEFHAWADGTLEKKADEIVASEADFFRQAYGEAVIGMLNQALTAASQGKIVKIDLTVNGTPYIPNDNVKNILNKDISINQTIFY